MRAAPSGRAWSLLSTQANSPRAQSFYWDQGTRQEQHRRCAKVSHYKVVNVSTDLDVKATSKEPNEFDRRRGWRRRRGLCLLQSRYLHSDRRYAVGSANNIARSLGIARTPADFAEQLHVQQVQQFYLTNVAGEAAKMEVTVEGFGIGLIPAFIKRRAKSKKADEADDIRRGRRALGWKPRSSQRQGFVLRTGLFRAGFRLWGFNCSGEAIRSYSAPTSPASIISVTCYSLIATLSA
jgi:hypothetical protein